MWKFHQPVEVIFGNKEVEKIGVYMEERGFEKAILIADPVAVKMGVADRIKNASKGRIIAITSDVEPNPSIQNINSCADTVRKCGAKCIVAVGGGSAMDCAKSTGVAVSDNCSAEELLEGHVIKSSLPLIAIPTTSGTGSEVTAGAVISNKEKRTKEAIFSPIIFAKLAIVDPELTYTCPSKVTANTGIDVLAHSLDALSSVKAQPATDALAVRAAKLVFENLRTAVKDGNNKAARENMSMASVIAGLAFSQTGTTGSHACSYILTSKYNIPHGEACAFTLDSWFVINAEVRPVINDYAKVMGFESAEKVSEEINALKRDFGMRTTLDDIKVKEKDLDEIVRSCMASGNMANNIAQIGSQGVLNIFKSKR